MKRVQIAAAVGAAMLAAWAGQPSAARAAQAAPAAPERSIVKVAGDLYRFQNNQHYGLFLVTPAGVVVADPINRDTANWLQGEIAARFNNAKVAVVIHSHHHWDHASGAAAFEGARVIGRPEMTSALQGPAASAGLGGDAGADANRDGLLQRGEATGALAANFAAFDRDGNGGLSGREIFDGQFKDVRAPTETWATPVHVVELGGKRVELHYVGGLHAADLAYIYFPAEKTLMVVDVISPGRLQNIAPNYDERHQFSLIDKALSFDAAFVAGGHGRVGTKADVEAQRAYLTDLRQGVAAAIAAGQTVEQAKASVKLEKYADWIAYRERIGPNVEGMYAVLKR